MMDERVRRMFREEMSAVRQPPLDGLVDEVVRGGRRARRVRRLWFGSGGVAAVAATAAIVGLVVSPGGAGGAGGRQAAAPMKEPVPMLAASSTSTVIKQPPGPKLPVTDAAVVEQLARLLPSGKTSGYARGPKEAGRYAFGQIYLDTGHGPGMVRVFVYKGGLSKDACGAGYDEGMKRKREFLLSRARSEAQRKAILLQLNSAGKEHRPVCSDLPGGGRAAATTYPDGSSFVSVDHGNGVVVEVLTPTWLAYDGKGNPVGKVALTTEQATRIAAYPGWGATMDAALVKKAAIDYPSLPVVY